MKVVENQKLDMERALYGSQDILVKNCVFDGPADGESALKESSHVEVEDCFWNLRYPFWHDHDLKIKNTELTELCRAALWYSDHIEITDSKLHGIKALRECQDVKIQNCHIISPEFGWSVNNIEITDTSAQSEYFMMRSENLTFKNVKLDGKYSFQYIENGEFENCEFNTKDAFWHAKNVTVRDSVIKGEYFSWYSDGLTLVNCKIIGTQPLCYCKNLRLINCQMEAADLAFEKSQVEADVTTPVISIKNPASGCIQVPAVDEIIMDDPKAKCRILVGEKEDLKKCV